MMRVGHGYDVHRFAEGRDLWLCGIKIPYEYGLDGHSDADVALHAITDAVCGALALGDIGAHFPDTDQSYKNADSKVLFSKIWEIATDSGWQLSNVDTTIVCEKPKLAPYVQQMRECVSGLFGTSIETVSVKATTSEGMGFVGRKEGIACNAVVLITKTT